MSNTCYVERSKVREILLSVSDENVGIAEHFRIEVDGLPIMRAADFGNRLAEPMSVAAQFLDDLANTLDRWADASLTGGWSTHQVDSNRAQANECRRKAAQLRAAVAV
jgi:hypothetical protein